jgi:hypothetical protein
MATKKEATSGASAETREVAARESRSLASEERKTMELAKQLSEEDKVEIALAPSYRAYFGNVMTVGLNGITIYFPIDGRKYKVSKSFAAIIEGRRRSADDYMLRKNRLADVQNNVESYAGELKMY